MISFAHKLLRSTKEHSTYWENRKIDWKKQYLDTWNHPHRKMISSVLSRFQWTSLFEVGCGPGANLVNISNTHKNKQLGGMDLNPEAIELAQKTFLSAVLKVGSADDIPMSDNSADVILTDMTLIYIGDIDKAIREIKRVGRNYVVLCELHTSSFYDRIRLKYQSGYFAHDYKKLLTNAGFYEIELIKIPREVWDGKPQINFGYIIKAKIPQRK